MALNSLFTSLMITFVAAAMTATTTTTTQAFQFQNQRPLSSYSAIHYDRHHNHIPTTKKTSTLFASAGGDDDDDDDFSDRYADSLSPEEVQAAASAAAAAARVQPPSPPPQPIGQNAPTKRLDPLMASLTRTDPNVANLPTRNVPFFGEVPVDGSLTVLVPAAAIAVLGFVLSIVVAFNSKDLLASTLSQVSDEISSTAVRQSNQNYDESACRGICSSQQDDLEGLRKFMGTLKKKD